MKICLTACRVLIGILIVLCVFYMIVAPLTMTFYSYDASPSVEGFFYDCLIFLPNFLILLTFLFPLVAFEGWLQYKLGWMRSAQLKRRVWTMAICEIVLLTIILILVILGNEVSHTVLTQIE